MSLFFQVSCKDYLWTSILLAVLLQSTLIAEDNLISIPQTDNDTNRQIITQNTNYVTIITSYDHYQTVKVIW